MEIIDAHHHLWDRGRFNYSWLAQAPDIDRDFILADYEESIAETDVVKSVFVQADVDEVYALQEARWALSIAEVDSVLSGVVAWAPVERPELEDYLQTLGEHAALKGIRRLIQSEADAAFCTRPEFVEGVRSLAERGLSFDLCIYHPQLSAATELVRMVPEVQFVLDHVGKPDIQSGLRDPWERELRALAELPNVCCKVSGMVTEADVKAWTRDDLRPYIDCVLEAFGPDRTMFGSDWPVCLLGVSYGEWLQVVQEAVSGVSAAEQEQIFYGTAARFYRL